MNEKKVLLENKVLLQGMLYEDLRRLKKAWDEFNRAETDMARMRSYPNMSYSMKADFNKASLIATESRRTIDSILGGVR